MKNINPVWVLYISLLSGFLFIPIMQAKIKLALNCEQIQPTPLSKEMIRDYIETSVAIVKLQNNMQAHANQYDNLIKSFYKKRKALLESRGWTVEDYEGKQNRIFAAQNAMDQEADLKSEQEFKKEIAEIRANPYYSEKQKSGIIEIEQNYRKHIMEEIINPTKPDWPAVKAYQKELKHLTDYAAQNRADPPVVKENKKSAG